MRLKLGVLRYMVVLITLNMGPVINYKEGEGYTIGGGRGASQVIPLQTRGENNQGPVGPRPLK